MIEAVRRAIQGSQESLKALARRYGVNQKTIRKWKRREQVGDLKTDPKQPGSTVLSLEQEVILVGEAIKIKAKTTVKFRPAKSAKDAVVPLKP